MKKFAGLTAGLLALGLAGAAIADDDEIITDQLDLTGFERIDISGVYDLDVRVGPEFSVELSGPEYEMNRVEASVRNGALKLDMRDRKRGEKRRWRNKREGVDAVITLPMLTGVEVSGVVDGTIKDVNAGEFEIDISGVGDVEIDGECGVLDANLSGVGDLSADGLECNKVIVKVSGVGDADVYARDEVDARVSGMGDIDVYGSPENVRKSSSMFSDITVH
ncbi:MAG: head GIN domain-containing protein [Pseudomonadota bacterium]